MEGDARTSAIQNVGIRIVVAHDHAVVRGTTVKTAAEAKSAVRANLQQIQNRSIIDRFRSLSLCRN